MVISMLQRGYSVLLLLVTLCSYATYGQEVTYTIDWKNVDEKEVFNGGLYNPLEKELLYTSLIPIESNQSVKDVTFTILSKESNLHASKFPEISTEKFKLNWYLVTEKKKKFIKIEIPALINNRGLEQLKSFSVAYQVFNNIQKRGSSDFANTSKLSTGSWYKMSVDNTGIYKLTYSFLKELGIDVDNVNPQTINIYGNGIGALPLNNNQYRPDDLLINKIEVVGGSDGVFNKNDYILFYAQGPDTWSFSSVQNKFIHKKHDYSDVAHYFIGIGVDAPSRITTVDETVLPANYVMTEFDDYQFHEKELMNLIGSGRLWLGETLKQFDDKSFNFSFPNIVIGADVKATTRMYGRTLGVGQSSVLTVNTEGIVNSYTVAGVEPFDLDANYADGKTDVTVFSAIDPNIGINVSYNGNGISDEAWVDYISINARRQLTMFGSQMLFRDIASVGSGTVAQINLSSNLSNVRVWDVTNKTAPQELNLNKELGVYTYKFQADSLHEFVAHSGAAYYTPVAIGEIPTQNLHAITPANYIIITHPLFINQAKNLAEFHNEKQGLSYQVINVHDIYNEFSSGTQDATAIKDFLRMLYGRSEIGNDKELQYVLLFGDGSYNNRKQTTGNTNFIPTFQSFESLKATTSFASDDYFALLDDNESYLNTELIDVGIGRFPVQTVTEAQNVVNKSKTYLTGNNQGQGVLNVGDWKNKICFVADDEDSNIHLNQSKSLSSKVESENPTYNIQKIYLDAYKQTSTPGGERYYEAQDDLREAVQNGALIINYTGHGGEVGWAHERVLDLNDIKGWTNGAKLPVFMTATCEFSRFDDPERTSAGEYVLLNENGGGVALLSTTRVVYSSPNFSLNTEFYNYALNLLDEQGNINRLGEIVKETKNKRASSSTSTNHRNFALLGDPALPISLPKKKVVTTTLNNNAIGLGGDTLKALGKYIVAGEIRGVNDSLLSDYNGFVIPVVFGKSQELQTLGTDDKSFPSNFSVQNNVIYKGKSQVENGKFTFSFVVPKDISAALGNAKISYYAWNAELDASGHEKSILVGGTSDNIVEDNVAPEINVYLNDEQFVNGGLVNQNPVLIAKLFDDNGLNTVGTGIGHDITAIIDNDVNNPIVLNQYYEADIDQYQSGQVKYPLSNLSSGNHTLKLKAWDVHNNSSETKLEFVVANNAGIILDHVLNYPNPFTTSTDFYFEHNQPGVLLLVKLQVFTISGKVVKSFEEVMQTVGTRSNPIRWNGLDDFGDKIGRGAYIYKLSVTTSDGKKIDKFEKLVKF